MRYEFPAITHIDEVLEVIRGRKEFIVAERDDYTVVNYVVAMEDTFPVVESEREAILRECRGIVFDKTGRVVARRFHKFFNVNEREETQLHKIDISQPHVILEKLDGSMITPIPIGDHFRLGTKMGITEVAMSAEEFLVEHRSYTHFINQILDQGATPIFEYCSRKHRIVVDYPEDRLVLLAIRDNESGAYWSYDTIYQVSQQFYGIEVVGQYPGTVENMQHLVESIRGEDEGEGWILRFADGHMVKMKNETYLRLHKTKDRIRYERNIVDLILNSELDDLKSFMLEDDLARVREYEAAFWHDIVVFVDYIDGLRTQYAGMDRKNFAINVAPTLIAPVRSLLFALWEGGDTQQRVLEWIGNNVGNNTRFANVKFVFETAQWNELDE